MRSLLELDNGNTLTPGRTLDSCIRMASRPCVYAGASLTRIVSGILHLCDYSCSIHKSTLVASSQRVLRVYRAWDHTRSAVRTQVREKRAHTHTHLRISELIGRYDLGNDGGNLAIGIQGNDQKGYHWQALLGQARQLQLLPETWNQKRYVCFDGRLSNGPIRRRRSARSVTLKGRVASPSLKLYFTTMYKSC